MADLSSSIPVDLTLDHIPSFITGPGQGDWLFQFIVALVVIMVLLIGNAYLHLHSLPDRMAHRANSTQLQVVGILTLLALFTHNNLYWVAALLLVSIQLPDIVTPLNSIARSLEAGRKGMFSTEQAKTTDQPDLKEH